MHFKPNLLALCALLCICAPAPASAQQVYKCGSGRSVTYTEQPCSNRKVNTDDAPVPVKPNPREADLRRLEENRALARTLHREPGESAAQFESRRRRVGMLPEDRAECARLDKRMPVEKESLKNPDPEEVFKADAALNESSKQFHKLRC